MAPELIREDGYTKLIDYFNRWETDMFYGSTSSKIPKYVNKSSIRRIIPKSAIPIIKKLLLTLLEERVTPVNLMTGMLMKKSR